MILRYPPSLLATWFGAGLLPAMPGTWGALTALPLAAALQYWGGTAALVAGTVVVFAVGVWACDKHIARLQVDDPASAVIDEVAGQWLALWLAPLNVWAYLLAFIAFRAFDILKPWPIGWADRHVPGGLGTMIDDVIAGLYALAVVYGVTLMFGGANALP